MKIIASLLSAAWDRPKQRKLLANTWYSWPYNLSISTSDELILAFEFKTKAIWVEAPPKSKAPYVALTYKEYNHHDTYF